MELQSQKIDQPERLLPLLLGVARQGRSENDLDALIQKLSDASVKQKIFDARGALCAYCGFKPLNKKLLFIQNIDENYSDFSLKNLAPICGFCKACFHLKKSAENGGARLVVWPELSQSQINRALRGLYVAREAGYKDAADLGKRIFVGLNHRAQIAYQGWGTSDPAVFAEALLSLNLDSYKEMRIKLKDLRLIPTPKNYFLPAGHLAELVKEANQENPGESRISDLMYSLVLKEVSEEETSGQE